MTPPLARLRGLRCASGGDAVLATMMRLALCEPAFLQTQTTTLVLEDGTCFVGSPTAAHAALQDATVENHHVRLDDEHIRVLAVDIVPHVLQVRHAVELAPPRVEQLVVSVDRLSSSLQEVLELLLRLQERGTVGAVDHHGQELVLIHIAHPSHYLSQTLEELSNRNAVQLWHGRDGDRILLPWGQRRHPRQDNLNGVVDAQHLWLLPAVVGDEMVAVDRADLGAPLETLVLPQFQQPTTLSAQPLPAPLPIPVELRASPIHASDLVLLDEDALLRWGRSLTTTSSESLRSLLLTRLEDGGGHVRYVLRRRPHPDTTEASLLDDVEGVHFSRAHDVDGLWVQQGHRVSPPLSADRKRRLFSLDEVDACLLSTDADGLRIWLLPELQDLPAETWTEYVATDRRSVLDVMLEEAVAQLPRVQPKRARPPKRVDSLRPSPPAPTREEPSSPPPPSSSPTSSPPPPREQVVLRSELTRLEKTLSAGGVDDARLWREAAWLAHALDEWADAAFCASSAVFFDGATAPEMASLLQQLASGPDDAPPDLFALVSEPSASSTRRRQLAAALLQALLADAPRPPDAAIEAALTSSLGSLPSRLVWRLLHLLFSVRGDELGWLRARERVLGHLFAADHVDLVDAPLFARRHVAQRPSPETTTANAEALAAVTARLDGVDTTERLHPLAALSCAILQVGHQRCGSRLATLLHNQLLEEVDAHDVEHRALLQLYLERSAAESSGAADDDRRQALRRRLDAVADPRARALAAWFAKRSSWLSLSTPDLDAPWVRPTMDAFAVAGEEAAEDAVAALESAFDLQEAYDYEVVAVAKRLLRAARATGRDEVIEPLVAATMRQLPRIHILGHRADAAGSCLQAAAALASDAHTQQLVKQVVRIAHSDRAPPVAQLLHALEPALSALRRRGDVDAARRLLRDIEPLCVVDGRPDARMLAYVARGKQLCGQADEAQHHLQQSLGSVLDDGLPHVQRFDGACAVLDAVRGFPLDVRRDLCVQVASSWTLFKDTFTARAYWPTHQLLVLERLVDALADNDAQQDDQLLGFLEREEHATRMYILSDTLRRPAPTDTPNPSPDGDGHVDAG